MNTDYIKEYLYSDYLNNVEESTPDQRIISGLEAIKNSGLITVIKGRIDLYLRNNVSKYNIICKLLLSYNKSLKNHIINISEVIPFDVSDKVDASKEIIKMNKYILDAGIYYTELDHSSDGDNYAVLNVKLIDVDFYEYTLYLVGPDCYSYQKKINKKFKKYKDIALKSSADIIGDDNGVVKEARFKPFDQVIFNGKNDLINYIDNWVEHIPEYYKYGITPKLSILFYGNPGTGKSTCYKAIAKYLGINRVLTLSHRVFENTLSLDPKNNRNQGSNFNMDKTKPTVIAIDDIDCIGNSRDKDDSIENSKIIHSLLSYLDEPSTFYFKAKDGLKYPVSIVIATTNYIDRLDPAVKRYGRFDLQIEMKDFNKEEAEKMCKLYNLSLDKVLDEKPGKDFNISPAKLQALCISKIDKYMKKY